MLKRSPAGLYGFKRSGEASAVVTNGCSVAGLVHWGELAPDVTWRMGHDSVGSGIEPRISFLIPRIDSRVVPVRPSALNEQSGDRRGDITQ
jgi:hypothetical protein